MKKRLVALIILCVMIITTSLPVFAVENITTSSSHTCIYSVEVPGSESTSCDPPRCGLAWAYPENENTFLELKCANCSNTTVGVKKTGCCGSIFG